jgi:hypothetical protein
MLLRPHWALHVLHKAETRTRFLHVSVYRRKVCWYLMRFNRNKKRSRMNTGLGVIKSRLIKRMYIFRYRGWTYRAMEATLRRKEPKIYRAIDKRLIRTPNDNFKNFKHNSIQEFRHWYTEYKSVEWMALNNSWCTGTNLKYEKSSSRMGTGYRLHLEAKGCILIYYYGRS